MILTKQENSTLCKSFKVPPGPDAVECTYGSLECSYPKLATEIPNEVFDDGDFPLQLASFLSCCNVVDSDLPPFSTHPQCIMALFIEMQRSQQCRGKRDNESLVGDSPNYRV